MPGYNVDPEIERQIVEDTILICMSKLKYEANKAAIYCGANTVGLLRGIDILRFYQQQVHHRGS